MSIGIIVRIRTTGLPITIGSHYCVTMNPSHADCLPPRENETDRRINMDGPVSFYLLTLEYEEHLKKHRHQQ
jgi:hypothetical protein